MATDPISEYLQASLETYLANLHEIVSIDSGTHSKPGVDSVGVHMEGWLRDTGCEVTRLPHDVYGDSLVARLRGAGSRKVVMVGHMDTVYPDGTAAARPFYISGDRAYGPGASDMKNGILAGMYAMRALLATEQIGFGEIVLFLNPDEEVGSPSSSQAILAECRGAAAALVLESGRQDGSVVVGRKGVSHYKLTAHGRSAHAGVEPEKGRSAVIELAHKVLALAALNGLTEGTTVNVGTIEGGTRRNVIADRATCDVDVRITTAGAQAELDAELRRIAAQPAVPDTRVEVEYDHWFPPMEANERNQALFETASEVASRLGLNLRGVFTGGGSDANRISAAGVPVLDGLGPIGRGAHSPEESLLIPSVPERTSLLAHLLLEVGG